jgi:hypothetical protein
MTDPGKARRFAAARGPAASAKKLEKGPWQASLFELAFTRILDLRLSVDKRLAFTRTFAFSFPAGRGKVPLSSVLRPLPSPPPLCGGGEGRGGGAIGKPGSRKKGGKPFVRQKITNSFQDMGEARFFEEGGARRRREDSSRSALSSNSRSLRFLTNQEMGKSP